MPHAAIEHAVNALLIDERNAKAAFALVKADLGLGYSGCNGWQEEALDHLAASNQPLADLRKEHRKLLGPRPKVLLEELGLDGQDPRKVPLQAVPQAEPRLLRLLADDEPGEQRSREAQSCLLTAALVRGSEAALIPAAEALAAAAGEEGVSVACEALAAVARAPLMANMEAALCLGGLARDPEDAFLHLGAAASSQDPALLEAAGEALISRILAQHGGKWNTGSPYATWLMACGGQADRIASLMRGVQRQPEV